MPLTQEEDVEMMEAEQAAYDQALIAAYEREQWLGAMGESLVVLLLRAQLRQLHRKSSCCW